MNGSSLKDRKDRIPTPSDNISMHSRGNVVDDTHNGNTNSTPAFIT